MKTKLVSLIITLYLLCACAGPREGVYQTTVGIIKKGYSKQQVVKILGQPQNIRSNQGVDVWYYSFDNAKNLFVYFIDDKLTDVWQKS